MIQITNRLYIGSGQAAESADLPGSGFDAILCVAHDMHPVRDWFKESMIFAQCGLIDGPGNRQTAYLAAAAMLAALIGDGRKVLVCCHCGNGGRSLAAVLFFLQLTDPRGWDEWLSFLREKNPSLENPHVSHRVAFERVDWSLTGKVMGVKKG